MPSEFDLIARYFTRPPRYSAAVKLGVGDDCALFSPSPERHIAVSTDMLVEGRHFFPGVDPVKLGHKSLAVNLSDLAAMGAEPLAFTLALALPAPEADWLSGFSSGLLALADRYECDLIGGDTTKGPLNICITIFGQVDPARVLRRDAARAGDDIWISGTLGNARLALAALSGEVPLDCAALQEARESLDTPEPRVRLGVALGGIANAAIDVSDGLIGDLGHILEKSQMGATLNVDALPCGMPLAEQAIDVRRRFTLAGGDDYELCFTAPAARRELVREAGRQACVPVTRVGVVETAPGLRLTDADGRPLNLKLSAFDHFAS